MHIDVRYHFIKKKVENGIMELYFVWTEYQLDDIFTKPFSRDRFNFLIEKLGMRSMSLEMLKRLPAIRICDYNSSRPVCDSVVQQFQKCNYGVTCEDEAKKRNSGTKTKTFVENCYLLLYAHINSFLEVVEPLKVRRLSHDRFRLSIFPISLSGATSKWFTNECIGPISNWDDLVEKFIQKFYNLFDHDEEEEAEDDDDPNMIDDVPEIFKIKDNLFNFDTPLCIAFKEFNYLLKINPDLFTYDIQGIKTYDEYQQELNNDKTRGLDEQWSENGVPYQLCDHICEPYRFKNGITKWLTCSSDTDGYCNGGELPGMVRVGRMTYFQNHKCFENFHELNYDVLVKLEECWWKVNTDEVCPFTRWDNRLLGPYTKAKPKWTFDPYLNINRKPERNNETNNGGNIQEGQRWMEDLTHEPSACKIRRFEMTKYTFEADEKYVAIKELEHINHSETNMDARYAYRELFRKMDDGWLVTRAMDE
ncbi:hypothetical protein Tco_1220547 [Tanacetum coccineum]